MTSDRITERNRANGAKSTGPKTAEGKAAVSGNARRHGATSRPDPNRVAAWLRIILDDPDVTPAAMSISDERGFRALVLAEAEAGVAGAEFALREFEAGRAEQSESMKDLLRMAELVLEDLQTVRLSHRDIRSGLAIVRRIRDEQRRETMWGGDRHRLLRRYLREARARRSRAFSAWLEVAGAAERTDVEAA